MSKIQPHSSSDTKNMVNCNPFSKGKKINRWKFWNDSDIKIIRKEMERSFELLIITAEWNKRKYG